MIVDKSIRPNLKPDETLVTLSSTAAMRTKLSAQVDAFLNAGGSISEIPPGVSRYGDESPNRPTRVDGTAPRNDGPRQFKYFIDDSVILGLLADGVERVAIVDQLVEKHGCSRTLINSKIRRLTAKTLSDEVVA